jgi:F420-non-reducing hydrogenase iron-sulfur subunit
MEQMGMDKSRLRLEWISAAEGEKFARVITEFNEHLTELGPNPLKIKVEAIQ